jgi:curved DNA-binding protein CbpA
VAIDLYAELGVSREASVVEIRRAYRRRAKHAHPDAGGSPEAFERLQLAHDILTDPEKRRTYDETGAIDEPRADNMDAAALGIISQLLASFLDGDVEPHEVDLRRRMIDQAREMLDGANKVIARSGRAAARARKLMGRFKTKADSAPTPVEVMLQRQISQNEAAEAKHKFAKTAFVRAIEMLEAWDFDHERPMPADFGQSLFRSTNSTFQQRPFFSNSFYGA